MKYPKDLYNLTVDALCEQINISLVRKSVWKDHHKDGLEDWYVIHWYARPLAYVLDWELAYDLHKVIVNEIVNEDEKVPYPDPSVEDDNLDAWKERLNAVDFRNKVLAYVGVAIKGGTWRQEQVYVEFNDDESVMKEEAIKIAMSRNSLFATAWVQTFDYTQ